MAAMPVDSFARRSFNFSFSHSDGEVSISSRSCATRLSTSALSPWPLNIQHICYNYTFIQRHMSQANQRRTKSAAIVVVVILVVVTSSGRNTIVKRTTIIIIIVVYYSWRHSTVVECLTSELSLSCTWPIVGQVTILWVNCPLWVSQWAFHPPGSIKKVVIHVNMGYGSKRQMAWWERCSLPPTWLSAPSCKARVYARCWLKTMEMGDERPLPVLWVVRGLLALGLLCLLCYYSSSSISSCSSCHSKCSINNNSSSTSSSSRRRFWYHTER